MKTKLYTLLLALAALAVTTSAAAQAVGEEFKVGELYYKITSLYPRNEVMVSIGSYAKAGEITVPSTVSYLSETFTVTAIGYRAFRDAITRSIIIPDEVYFIGQDAFLSCNSLTSVTFSPNSKLNLIDDNAFRYCKSLYSFKLPNTTITIGKNAFYDCISLKNFEISPDSKLQIIGEFAFYNCIQLSSITFPSGITDIGRQAFEVCNMLTKITSYIADPRNTNTHVLLFSSNFSYSSCTLYVPYGSKAFYQEILPWMRFTNIVEMVENYPLYVAGTQVTSANAANITGTGITGKISYNHAAKTLKLDKAIIATPDFSFTEGISVKGQDLKIELTGKNEIILESDANAIDISGGDLTISGPSTSTLEIRGIDSKSIIGNGIYSSDKVMISGCKVSVKANDNAINATSISIDNNAAVGAYSERKYGVLARYLDVLNSSQVEAQGISYAMNVDNMTIFSGAHFFEGNSKTQAVKVTKLTVNGSTTMFPYILIRPAGTGLESLHSQGIQVWGGKGIIEISAPQPPEGGVVERIVNVYGLSGALVHSVETWRATSLQIPMQPGIYIVRIGNGAEKVLVR